MQSMAVWVIGSAFLASAMCRAADDPAVDLTSPRGAAIGYLTGMADKDSAKLKAVLFDANPALIDGICEVDTATAEMKAAEEAKFGPEHPGQQSDPRAFMLNLAKAAKSAPMKINSDHATITVPNYPPIEEQRFNGLWHVKAPVIYSTNMSVTPDELAKMRIEARIERDVTREIQAGRFGSRAEVLAARRARQVEAEKTDLILSGTDPTLPQDDASVIKRVAKAWFRAMSAGDSATLRTLSTANHLPLIEAMARATASSNAVHDALDARFPDAHSRAEAELGTDGLIEQVSAAKVATQGQTATLLQNGLPVITFSREGGQWKVDQPANWRPFQINTATLNAIADAKIHLAKDIAAGKYANLKQARDAERAVNEKVAQTGGGNSSGRPQAQ